MAKGDRDRRECASCNREFFPRELEFCAKCDLLCCPHCLKSHLCKSGKASAAALAAPAMAMTDAKVADANGELLQVVSKMLIPKHRLTYRDLDPQMQSLLKMFRALKDGQTARWRLSGDRKARECTKVRVKNFLRKHECRFLSACDADWLYLWKPEPASDAG